jgi:hypothetical protein
MDKEKICKSVRDQLEDIREQFEIIRSYEGKIPSIELDLILSNIREVYEQLLQLEKINQPPVSFTVEEKPKTPEKPPAEPEPVVFRVREPEKPVPPPPPVEETISREEQVEVEIPEEPVEEEIPEEPVAEFVPEEPPVFQPVEEPEEEPEEIVVEKPVEKPVEPPSKGPVTPPGPVIEHRLDEPVAEARPVKTTLDLFGETTSTLADRLKDNAEKRIADKLQANKIGDLRNAIGINEKFLYINELFDGSLRDYEEAVNKLNTCPDPDEAGMIIFELRERYHWDLDNPAVRSFIELVNRKF